MKLLLSVNSDIGENNMMAYSFPLAILTSNPKVAPYVMENYVVPFTYDPFENDNGVGLRMLYLDAYCISEEISLPQSIMHQDNYAQGFFENKPVVETITQLLNANQYAVVFCDDYYLPNSALGAKRRHFLHETLFYGYDDEKHELYALAMTKQRQFGKMTHRYEDVENAFKQGDICNIHGSIEWVREHRIIALKVPDYSNIYPFDPLKLAEGLRTFVDGTISPKQRFYLDLEHKGKLYVGYDYVLFVANLVEHSSPLFFRYVHHLYEHAKLLKERIEYTKTYVNFDEAYLSAFYDQVLILSQIRTKALKLDIMMEEQPQAVKEADLCKLATGIRVYADNIRGLIVRWVKLLGLDIE